jgi:hypothetical protein
LKSALSRPQREIAFRQRLQSPGDPFDKPRFVLTVRSFAENFAVFGLKLRNGHAFHSLELFFNHHRISLLRTVGVKPRQH